MSDEDRHQDRRSPALARQVLDTAEVAVRAVQPSSPAFRTSMWSTGGVTEPR